MTLEQAIKRIQDKQSQVTQLTGEIEQTKRKLKELTPYKVGDKVKVTDQRKRVQEVYISDVEWYWSIPYYKYKFSKKKKDGTMSEQSAGIYYYDEVELIKRKGE